MTDLIVDTNVDRLSTLASSDSIDQLLAVYKLTTRTRQAMRNAIIKAILITQIGFDTTAFDTGRTNGVFVLLEATLGRNTYNILGLSSSYSRNYARGSFFYVHGPFRCPRDTTVQTIQDVLVKYRQKRLHPRNHWRICTKRIGLCQEWYSCTCHWAVEHCSS